MRELNLKNLFKLLALLVMVAVLIPLPSPVSANPGGPRAKTLYFIEYVNPESAILSVMKGTTDWYYFNVPVPLIDKVKSNPNVYTIENPFGGPIDMLLNPAPFKNGEFNPFTLKEVRFALNYLIDRNFIGKEVYKGYFTPAATSIAPLYRDYLYIKDVVEKYDLLRPSKTRALGLINDAMRKAGAKLVNGKWYYNGKPVTVKVAIRIEDERLQVGDYVASLLEQAGFTVQRMHINMYKAFAMVYQSDPADGEWNVYTEGWNIGFGRKVDWMPAVFAAPWVGELPGWGEPSYWNVNDPEADAISQKLLLSKYNSEIEREQLMKKMTEIEVDRAYRIWLGVPKAVYVVNKKVHGVIADFFNGAGGRWAMMNAYREGSDEIKVAAPSIHTSAWNPMGGFTWVYDANIERTFAGFGLATHPFQGIVIPWQTVYKVETNYKPGIGPQPISVPQDAIIWNPKLDKWVKVGPGVKAKSHVIYNMKYVTKYHDGSKITVEDAFYNLYMWLEWGSDDSQPGKPDKYYDPDIESSDTYRYATLIKGVRKINDTAFEVWGDYWNIDDWDIANILFFGPDWPWDALAVWEGVVTEGKYAFGESSSKAKGIPQLDLVNPKQNADVEAKLKEYIKEKYVPMGMKGLITPDEAVKRYKNLLAFEQKYKHTLVSYGPYMLVEFNPTSGYVKLVANKYYPFGPEKWADFVPATASIDHLFAPDFIDKTKETSIKVLISVAGQPSSKADVVYRVVSRATLTQGKTIYEGTAQPGKNPGEFVIKLEPGTMATWPPGPYELLVAAESKRVPMWNYASKEFFLVGPVKGQIYLGYLGQMLGKSHTYVGLKASEDDKAAAGYIVQKMGAKGPDAIGSIVQLPEKVNAFLIGGPEVNGATKEANGHMGIKFTRMGSSITIEIGGRKFTTTGADYGKRDYAVISITKIGDRVIVTVEGTTRYGTLAGARFLAENYQQMAGAKWVVLSWTDLNSNGKVDLNEIAVEATG